MAKEEKIRTPARLNIELSDEQVTGLNRLAYGERKAVFSALVDCINHLLDKNPDKLYLIVSAIKEGHIELRELINWR